MSVNRMQHSDQASVQAMVDAKLAEAIEQNKERSFKGVLVWRVGQIRDFDWDNQDYTLSMILPFHQTVDMQTSHGLGRSTNLTVRKLEMSFYCSWVIILNRSALMTHIRHCVMIAQ